MLHPIRKAGAPKREESPLADLLHDDPHEEMGMLVQYAIRRGLSIADLAHAHRFKRDSSAIRRSIMARHPRPETLQDLAKALGFTQIVGRALAHALTDDDVAEMRDRIWTDTQLEPPAGGAPKRIREQFLALKDADRKPFLAQYVLGEAGLLPKKTVGSPLPPGLAAVAAKLVGSGYPVGVVASQPIARGDQQLAQVGISLIQRALVLSREEILALRALLKSYGAVYPADPIDLAIFFIKEATDKAEAAARPALKRIDAGYSVKRDGRAGRDH